MSRCPRCGCEPDELIETDNPDDPDRSKLSYYCDRDRLVWEAEPSPHLVDPEPRIRRDTDG